MLDEIEPTTTMIDTSNAQQSKNEGVAETDGDARMFSRLKVDERFLAHLTAIEENLKVSDEELGKRAH